MTGREISRKHKWIRVLLVLVVLMVGLTTVAYAEEEAEVSLEINTANLQMGVSTELSMVLKNISNAKLVAFEGIDNFEILSSGQSNSTQIINGQSTKVSKVTYSITPKEVGSFKLMASIQVDEDIYQTNVIEITVTEMDESLSGEASDLFVRTTVSDDRVYFGQPLVISYDLYSMYQVDKFGFLDDVVVDGFIVQRNDHNNFQPNYLTINDNQFVMYRAEQLVLNPTKPGDYVIDAFDFQVNLGSGSMFSATKSEYLKTDEVSLSVLPLPTSNQPVNYSGLVGDLKIESIYEQTDVQNGDPITLKLTVSGSGNVASISDIAAYGQFEGFTVYETEKDIKEIVNDQGYTASKEFELILIPKVSGSVEIESFGIPYFDSVSEVYSELVVPATAVQIGEAAVTNSQSGLTSGVNSTEPLVISQVNYAPSPEDYIIITLSKKILSNLIVGLLILAGIIGGMVILFRWHTHNNDPIRLMKREVEKTEDDDSLYEVVLRLYRHVYGIDLRSSTILEIESVVEDETVQAYTKQVMYYMEHDKHYNNQRFKEVKDLVLRTIQIIMAF